MPMKKFHMTPTELKLKQERLNAAFKAGKSAIEELGLPYFLAKNSALGALREGQFQPFDDDVIVGVYAWDLAALQRACPQPTAARRDGRLISAFARFGMEPVNEVVESGSKQGSNPTTESACPRYFLAEGWSKEMAFPILYKFTHQESLVRFDIVVFAQQFGQLWDFADGGAETSCGWRYTPFSPQPMEFEKTMTFSMPASALEEHYGQDWHTSVSLGCYSTEALSSNSADLDEFRLEMRTYRIRYAKAMANADGEVPAKPLDLYKIEAKPMVLFQAAEICKSEGNERLKKGNAAGALTKYDEGLYIMDKCQEVLVTWRLIFRQIHDEKAENNRKERGLKVSDLTEPDMPREFRTDENDERSYRLALLLNGAQAALQLEQYDVAETKAGQALEIEPKNIKALFRRATARLKRGRNDAAKSDFWSMLKASNFESKEALGKLSQLMSKEDLAKEWKRVKAAWEKEQRLGAMITELDGDERVSQQDERYQRFLADCAQRKADGQREISFDDWVRQYEWRYDADERQKVRKAWPEFFSHHGPAPLPVEEWEVDYQTHKEIHKIMYNRQTQAMAAKRREREGVPKPEAEEPQGSPSNCLELDAEDEQ
eukprot:CAMPEP_0206428846 /NCGR_PEP_ID=MMETSP0324_2-20121206/5901_1 /ASSEMBLY_ACC=CAM_ASM_000836 /TAXON_ID=2866 /ORGANISM="Crypthecodinium cohnii, Strain Seligo" /LENGTH=601 /DNA_ID=CAMNT_0053894439 /DNA_START=42 /DNA_END=1845 /DNA_ORIENTATION=-